MGAIPDHIFREYDIRGIAGREITVDLAYRIGATLMRMLPATEAPVVVGRDARLSGPELQDAVIRGLTEAGGNVLDIDMVPTPLAYFAVFSQEAAGCVVITASHNPGEYNGFKLMRGQETLFGEDIQKLKEMLSQKPSRGESNKGHVRQMDIAPHYQEFLCKDIRIQHPLKVVIDAGNGVAGITAAPAYRALGCEVFELYCDPDGRFPNHHPDPTVEENMNDLKHAVIQHKADLGIAFDGDGDRIGVVDENGDIIRGDMLLLILARDVLKRNPGATIISEVKCSQHMYDDIAKRGGHGIMWKTGHSPIKAKMRETGALLAGEMSGHMFFADRYYGFDDAIYAGARLMEVLSKQESPLSRLLDDVPPSVSTPEIRVECPDARKFKLVEEAKAHFSALGYDIIDVDGMRLKFDDGWALLRASNTQPALVLRFEAPNEKRLEEMRKLLEDWLSSHL
jgi:Phosphomannomutase